MSNNPTTFGCNLCLQILYKYIGDFRRIHCGSFHKIVPLQAMKQKLLLALILVFCLGSSMQAQYSWNPVGAGADLDVQALEADTNNNVLYLGGIFAQVGSVPAIGIAKWDGANYSAVGSGALTGVGVSSLLMRNGNLIAGGTFTDIGGVLSNNISEWNGTNWAPLSSGLEITTGTAIVKALCVYNNELYAGGIFDNSASVTMNNIAKWDGANWQPVGLGTNGTVSSLCVFNNELYVGGTFTSAGGVTVNNIAKYDGVNWSDVGGGVSYTGAISVSALEVYTGGLYAGGSFTTAGSTPVNHIAKWDGLTWSDVGGGANYTGAISISALEVFKGDLVAGGMFDSLGSGSAYYVGKWNGANWSTMGFGMNGAVNSLKALRDTLYAGGLFTLADSNISLFVSQWQPSQASAVSELMVKDGQPGFYPNPVQDKIFLIGDVRSLRFTLYDGPGKEIFKKENLNNEIIFDRKNIAAGLYFYKISDAENRVLKQGKIMFMD